MLSFKHFRKRDEITPEEITAALQRMISLLLDGLVVHAVRGDALDYSRLGTDMADLRDQVNSEDLNPGDLLIQTGKALKVLQDYNRRTSDFSHAQAIELQKITSMLTGSIANLSVAGSTNVARLQDLEKQLERAAGLEDVRMLREKLAECLVGIREEKIRQQTTSTATIDELTDHLRNARAPEPGKAVAQQSLDATTGLGTRPMAELAISALADGTANAYAALFVIDRLHGLNTRFGHDVGDRMIVMFAQHLTQHLRQAHAIFRWSGPAFLALLETPDSLDRVRRSLAPLTGAKLEKIVSSRDREVLLPLNFSWTLLPLPLGGRASVTIDRLDAFLASKVGMAA